MTQYLIGIDVGTTGTKSLVVSDRGDIVAHAYEGYASATQRNGWFEQDARDWWRAVVNTVREVTADPEIAKRVAAISLSTQGGTLVPVDRALEPLYPAIVWNDQRCAEQRQRFAAEFGGDFIYQKSGWGLMNGLNAMQIAWLRDRRPEVYGSAAWFLSVPDYIALRLTGRAAVDISNVGINQLADIRSGAYDPDILGWLGISQAQLAQIVPSGTELGRLCPEAAAQLGLPEAVRLVAGAHDQYAGMLGAGIIEAGDILIGTGTAWAVTALSDAADFESGFAQSVAATGNWGSMATISSGGVCLDWFRANVAGAGDAALGYDEINAAALKRGDETKRLMFFPYFSGGSFPLNDPACKAAFVGLDLSHDRFDLAHAVMEGVAMQTAWIIDYFDRRSPVRKVKLSGGAAKSAPWMRLIADIVNRPVYALEVKDLPCVGAAILAGVGCGAFDSFGAAVERLNLREICYRPEPAAAAEFSEKRKRFMENAELLRGMR